MNLPEWVEFLRPDQDQAIQDIVEAFRSTDIAILEAPTGSGKTLIAEGVRQTLGFRTVYVCSSIELQHQFMRDFPYAKLILGRTNYTPLDTSNPAIDCGDCNIQRGGECSSCESENLTDTPHCPWCHPIDLCPYRVAKQQAILATLTCTNISYFLHETVYGPNSFKNRFIIIDEADTLEKAFINFIELSLTSFDILTWKLGYPTLVTKEEAWIEWCLNSSQKLTKILSSLNEKQKETEPNSPNGILISKQISRVTSVRSKLIVLLDKDKGIPSGNWVYAGEKQGKLKKSGSLTFKPIYIAPYINELLWKHGAKFLLMSATIISPKIYAKSLGL